MPNTPPFTVALVVAGLLLCLIISPFFTSATPTIPQTSQASPTASNATPPPMTPEQKDFVFAVLFLVLLVAIFALIEKCRNIVLLAGNTLINELIELLRYLRLRSLLREAANDIVGTYGPRPASTTDSGGTLPSTQAASAPSTEQNQQPGVAAASHDCSNTAGLHHHRACPASASA